MSAGPDQHTTRAMRCVLTCERRRVTRRDLRGALVCARGMEHNGWNVGGNTFLKKHVLRQREMHRGAASSYKLRTWQPRDEICFTFQATTFSSSTSSSANTHRYQSTTSPHSGVVDFERANSSSASRSVITSTLRNSASDSVAIHNSPAAATSLSAPLKRN